MHKSRWRSSEIRTSLLVTGTPLCQSVNNVTTVRNTPLSFFLTLLLLLLLVLGREVEVFFVSDLEQTSK
jgi:hypothetical protein